MHFVIYHSKYTPSEDILNNLGVLVQVKKFISHKIIYKRHFSIDVNVIKIRNFLLKHVFIEPQLSHFYYLIVDVKLKTFKK